MPKIVDHELRRRQYLDAVWRVVERDGASAVSVRTVAAEAGVSKTNITYYFPSRIDLLAAASDRLIVESEKRLAAMRLTHLDVDAAVAAWMVAVPDSANRRRQSEIWLLLVAERRQDPRAEELLSAMNRRVRLGMRRGIRVLEGAGLIHPDRDLDIEAARIHGLVDGLSLQTMNNPKLMPASMMRTVFRTHIADLQFPPG
jgi:AcrR family transcriptional regulator